MTEVDDFVEKQRAEYGTYVATQVILHEGARAYNPGDPVPVSNVKAYGYDKDNLVAKVGTKAADAVAPNPTKEG